MVLREIETREGKFLSAQHIYDPISERINFKEKKDYSSIPFDNVIDPVNYSEEWDPKFSNKTNLLADLNTILPSHNPALKNEYIEMVRTEKENDMINYIMSGNSQLVYNNYNKSHIVYKYFIIFK